METGHREQRQNSQRQSQNQREKGEAEMYESRKVRMKDIVNLMFPNLNVSEFFCTWNSLCACS